MSRQAIRKTKGAGIVEGVVGLVVLTISTVLAVLLLLNAGGAAYDKEKISLVADQAACYAISLPSDATRQPLVAAMVNQLLSSMGISNNAIVDVQDVTAGGQAAVQVSVTTSCSTLLTGRFASVMPSQIQMSDSTVVVRNAWYNGYMIEYLPSGQKLNQPLINATGALPADALPAYNISLVGMYKVR
jgi:hypothetical protein